MIVLRATCALLGAAAAIGALAVGRPAVFAITGSAGLLLFLLGAGLTASDAIPVRRLPLAGSLAGLVGGPLLVLRPATATVLVIGTAVAGLQGAALVRGRRRAAPGRARSRAA